MEQSICTLQESNLHVVHNETKHENVAESYVKSMAEELSVDLSDKEVKDVALYVAAFTVSFLEDKRNHNDRDLSYIENYSIRPEEAQENV